ncbi:TRANSMEMBRANE PROTEIN 214-LIKE [Salix purpurea]|uniref:TRANSMEMBRANE PROTEIN 214-LIKE n=1 Tax=Salix purpurea TaxID=77065 RepID=A0A9Q0WG31_SALPP|nr:TRANSMEMBRANE PROTEIN 214-LIKE [Salix purpurea]
MDENSALIAQLLMEDEIEMRSRNGSGSVSRKDQNEGGWKTVTYSKRNKKQQLSKASNSSESSSSDHRRSNGVSGEKVDVFQSIEQHSEDRRRRIEEEWRRREEESGERDGSKRHSDEDDGESDDGGHGGDSGGAGEEVKKVKKPKVKKPKVTVAEAAAKVDAGDLAAFLVDITASYETQQDILLMRFADYYGRAFSSVSSAQFPWLKIFKESSVAKLIDIPLAHVSQDVYKTSVDWLGQRSIEALGSFVLWSLDSILTDLASHQGVAKGSKKVAQQSPSKSQVAIFVVLAMALRRKPDVLINLLPVISENPKYQGQDKLPVIVWMIAQASQGDLVVGLYTWIRVLFPMLSGKSSSNPQSRDLILQLVERILSSPKARTILFSGAVKKGERLVPPSALELLMRLTFPIPSARVKATERFEAVYPTLKEVALAGSSGSKAMKQVTHQILNFAVKATGEGSSELSREASDIFIWCLTQNPDSYKQWDMFYLDNLEASVTVLRKLSGEWKDHLVKHSSPDPVRETLKSFRQKNEKALAEERNAGDYASLKEADKYCKAILGRLSQGHGCIRSLFIVAAALAVGAVVISQKELLDLQKLSAALNLPPS